MPHLTLHFLGTPFIQRDGVTLNIARNKAVALLCYLVVTNEPHSRDALAALLWPDLGQEKSLAALRSTLYDMTRVLGGDWLVAERKTLSIQRDAALWVDVIRFGQLLDTARADSASGSAHRPAAVLSRLADAVALYRGDFLHGFSLRDSPGFDAWQSLRTEQLRMQMASALERLVLAHVELGEPERAIPGAQRLLALDSTNEAAHRHLMRLYAWTGQRSEALKQYAHCVETLLDELGVRPQDETVRLHEAIKLNRVLARPAPIDGREPERLSSPIAEPPAPEGMPRAFQGNLPAPITSFVGRRSELSIIAQQLDDPACRLLTLSGPGGVGKTSLALEAARRRALLYRDGACFVPLAATAPASLLAPAIADALELRSPGQASLEARIYEHLRARELLIVLDNFEHLMEGATLVSEILARAPEVRIVVTSRERLNLRGEWELVIEGLPCAEDGAQRRREGSDAVELFVRSACRTDASFALTADNGPAVARICRLVGGMPLGIELAAACVRHFSCAEIAAQIERDLNFLVAPRDAPERQRSLRATFAYSWSLLSDVEKGVLRKLSVFRGGATDGAAKQVAGASLGSLGALMSKSLVRRTPAGRYELHELIRQYAAEELSSVPEERARTHDLHAEYYAALLDARRGDLAGPLQSSVMEEVAAELDNVRAGWRWAVDRRLYGVLGRALDGVCFVHEVRGEFGEIERALGSAAAMVRRAAMAPRSDRQLRLLLGRLLSRHGRFAQDVLSLAEASALVEESLHLLRNLDAREELGYTLDVAGRLAMQEGNHGAARSCFRGSLAIARAEGNPRGVATAMRHLSTIARAGGDHAKARRLLQKSLDAFRSLNDDRSVASCLAGLGSLFELHGDLKNAEASYREGLLLLKHTGELYFKGTLLGQLAHVLCLKGEFDEARRNYEECLRLGQAMGHPETVALALHGFGFLNHRQNDDEAAQRSFEESLALRRRLNARQGITESLTGLGMVAAARGEHERARGHFRSALEMAMEVGSTPLVLDILVRIAELPGPRLKGNRIKLALAVIAEHPVAERATRDRAARLLGPTPPRSAKPAHDAGQQAALAELSALVRDVLGPPEGQG